MHERVVCAAWCQFLLSSQQDGVTCDYCGTVNQRDNHLCVTCERIVTPLQQCPQTQPVSESATGVWWALFTRNGSWLRVWSGVVCASLPSCVPAGVPLDVLWG